MKTRRLFTAFMMTVVLTHQDDKAVAATTPRAIRRAETGLFIGAGQDFQQGTESLNGVALDSETGALFSYTLGLRGIGRYNESPYWTIRYTKASGSSRYRGNTQMGLSGMATTGNNAMSLTGRLGLVINGLCGDRLPVAFAPYVSVGLRRSNQDRHQALLPGSTLTYSNGQVGVGLLAAYVLARHWVIAFHALAGYTFAAQLSGDEPLLFTSTNGALQNGPITEALGDRPYSAFGATVTYLIYRRWQVAIRVRHAQWGFGGSAPLLIPTQTGRVLTSYRTPTVALAETLLTLEVSRAF